MQSKQLILLVMGVHLAGCSRFGVNSLDNPVASFYNNQSISASLASNLKVDLASSGIDEGNANIILAKAIALSSSLEVSSSLSFNKIAGEISSGSSYQRIAEKFIEGAMLGISETNLPDDQRVLAASVNSYTPIRTLAQAGAGLSPEEKQAAVEAISAQAVAKIQTTGVSPASLAKALTKISEKSVEAVSKSGVSGQIAKAMVKKAAGGATRGLSEMSISSEQAASLVQAVAAGSVKGISAFTETDDNVAADLLTEVSSGLSSGLSEIQDQVSGFDMYEALNTVESSIKEEAESTLKMDIALVEESFSTSQQELKLPAPLPVLLEGKKKLANEIFLEFNTTKNTNLSALDNNSNPATICYTSNGETPACSLTGDKVVCENNSSLYNQEIKLAGKVELKAISCMVGKTPSRVNTYLVQVKAMPPIYIENSTAFTSSNSSLPLYKDKAFLDSTICYTNNQSAPECALADEAVVCKRGEPYLSPINITKNQVIKAMSCATGFSPSQIVTISTQYQLDAPELSYDNDKLFARSPEQNTTICTNIGSAPECVVDQNTARCANGSKEFVESITPVANTEIQALTCRPGVLNSAISKFSYKQANEGISFSPASGSLIAEGVREIVTNGTGSATVCLSTETQPQCHLGFDGNAHCITGTTGNSTTLSVSENFTMFATLCDKRFIKELSASYDVPTPEPKLMLTGSEFNESQVFSYNQQLDLSLLAVDGNNQNATICYTQDGSQPDCSINEANRSACIQGSLYSGPLAINSPGKLYAQACMPNKVSSLVKSFAINFSLPEPTFSLPDGTIMEPTANQVALDKHSSIPNAKICYTTDQSQPACGLVNGAFGCANGTEYNAPIAIAQATQVKAVTCQDGYIGSAVASAQYTLKSTYSSPCAALKNQGQTQSGVYNIAGIGNVYCDMTTEGGGWTLFAVTTASRCAESLPYGPNAVDLNSTGYFSTMLKDVEHDQFLQVMKKDGTNTSFTILYDFNSGKKTLKSRIDNSVSSGEVLDWIVTYGNSLQNKVEYKGKRWRYSNNARTSSKWGGSSSYRFSNDDGIWGAANGNLDGNSPGPYLRNSQGAFGHENPNSGDYNCRYVYENGSSSSYSNLKNLLFLR